MIPEIPLILMNLNKIMEIIFQHPPGRTKQLRLIKTLKSQLNNVIHFSLINLAQL